MDGLSAEAARALPWIFELWAMPGHQSPPPPPWRTWVILGGRGAGKTRAGAEWVRSLAEGASPLSAGPCRRIALLADTYDQVREVMIEGESGIRAASPPDRRPVWEATRRRLVWPNGAQAQVFSAQDPEALRGPQFDAAWCDELAKWKRGQAVWDMLSMGLRLGEWPRALVTTTPRRNALLNALLAREDTVASSAPTAANAANLAPDFLEAMEERYGGSRLGRQELQGELLTDVDGALWSREALDRGRVRAGPEMVRIVVAVDPPATSGAQADACGIVVAGRCAEGRIWVLDDMTLQGAAPLVWAQRVVEAYRRHQADRVVAEVNQGGELVETLIRQVDAQVSYSAVRASRGKVVRAEPVAAEYERGRVVHVGSFPELEDQMCAFTLESAGPGRSPDRVDALVWAVTALMGEARAPRMRSL